MKGKPSFTEAVHKLSPFGISGELLYLIDLTLLAEIAWADGCIQKAEANILFDFLQQHVTSINRMAGCPVIRDETAKSFVEGLLQEPPNPELLKIVKELIPSVRFSKSRTPKELDQIKVDILNACLDIASSAVTKYPYGLRERFTKEEKECYHRLVSLFTENH